MAAFELEYIICFEIQIQHIQIFLEKFFNIVCQSLICILDINLNNVTCITLCGCYVCKIVC